MKRLTDEEFQKVQNRLSKIVNHTSSGELFELVLTKQENLMAVPIFVRPWFSEQILNAFLMAAQNYNHSEIVTTWIGVDDEKNLFRLSISPIYEEVSNLTDYGELTMMDTATFSGSPDWVFIHSTISVENYDIVVGTKDIIRLFTNESVEESFNKFSTEVNKLMQNQLSPQMQLYDNLQIVYQKLIVYNDSSPGTKVVIN
ncbi:MAG: hypothetical protein RLZZ381_958 [Cyanobacteriota bacterium]